MNLLKAEKMCRVCLENTGEGLQSIFMIAEGFNSNFAEMIMSISSSVQITLNDGFSNKICLKCSKKVLESQRFKLEIENNQEFLKSHLNIKLESLTSELLIEDYDDLDRVIKEEYACDEVVEDTNNLPENILNINETKIDVNNPSEVHKIITTNEEIQSPSRSLQQISSNEFNIKNNEYLDKVVKIENLNQTVPFEEINVNHLCEEQKLDFLDIFIRNTTQYTFYHDHDYLRTMFEVKDETNSNDLCTDPFSDIGQECLPLPMKCNYGEQLCKKPNTRKHCNKSFEQNRDLKKHLATYSGEKAGKPFECSYCNKKFARERRFEKHLLKHPSVKTHENSINHKTSPVRSNSPQHVFVFTSNKSFECEHCNKKFGQNKFLQEHLLTHVKYPKQKHKEKQIECDHCHQKFTKTSSLNRHLLIHTTEKKGYGCEQCNEKFEQKSLQQRHLLTHSTTFDCEQCHKKFFLKSSLSQHILTHMAEKETDCMRVPNKTFSGKFNRSHLISSNDYLGKEICLKCSEKVTESYKLKLNIEQNDKFLKSQYTIFTSNEQNHIVENFEQEEFIIKNSPEHSIDLDSTNDITSADEEEEKTSPASRYSIDFEEYDPECPQAWISSRTRNKLDSTSDCIVTSLLIHRFRNRPIAERELLLKRKRPTPQLNLRKKSNGQRFNKKVYTDFWWVCGCTNGQKLFCWPCLLLSVFPTDWNSKGVSDLDLLEVYIQRHECSPNHIRSCFKLRQEQINFHPSNQSITNIKEYNKIVDVNRYIIRKLIDVICFYSKQELLFKESDNRENYIELLYLLSTSDIQLKTYLESELFTSVSNAIQNGASLIESIANIVLEEIRNERTLSKFVSIIEDKGVTVCNKSQKSTVLRYVTSTGDIKERFIGFSDVSKNAVTVNLYICGGKAECVAYTYLPYKNNIIDFMHCYAHSLNLVFSQVMDCTKCKKFFDAITGFVSFFSKSNERSSALQQGIKKRFPTAEPINWSCSSRVLNAILDYKLEMKEFFLNIIDNPENWDLETTISARGLYSYFLNFDFNFLLQIFPSIFSDSDILFCILQEKCFDVSYCCSKMIEFISNLRDKRSDFDLIWDQFKNPEGLRVINFRKRLRVDNVEELEREYSDLYLGIIDTLIKTTSKRLANIERLSFMLLLNVNKFKEYSGSFPESGLNSLKSSFGEFFDCQLLKNELQIMYSSSEFADKTPNEILKYIVDNNITDVFKEVFKLCSLIFTLPQLSESAENSVLTFNRIKTYSQNTQNEDKSLAIISIERSLLISLKEKNLTFYDRIIDNFANKEKHIKLQYQKIDI